MSIAASVLEAMASAGCSAEQIVAVVRADELATAERRAAKREKDRLRQRKCRASHTMSRNVTRDSGDNKEGFPQTPSEEKISPPIVPPDDFSIWLRSLVGDEPCLIDLNVEPVRALLDRGMTREDIEAGVKAALAKQDFRAKYWRSFVGWIERAAKDRLASAPKSLAAVPASPADPQQIRLSMDTPDADRARYFIATGRWSKWWGYPPGDEDCSLPKELVQRCLEARRIAA